MMEGYYSAAFSAFPEEMSLFSSTTTGYLQDAIAEWSNRSCKRRRSCWDYDEDIGAIPSDENFSSCITNYNFIPDNNPLTSLGNDIKSPSTMDHPMETTREPKRHKNISSFSSSFYMDSSTSCAKKGDRRRKVVYPFDMVKPGGIEGDVTLNDINERILMPPKRPIRHPVGDRTCNPCLSLSGLGPSGKVVVALTRIHTQGRGTVTIIRTRG